MLNAQVDQGGIVIALEGDIDISTVDTFKTEVKSLIDMYKKDILFDCANLQFVDSTALGAFVAIRKMADANGVSVQFKRMSSRIYKLFVITSLDKIFSVSEVE
ncbi:MAG: STAS domain-containing protein [Clostridia bacterium]|nr:STAS domain-containing protein [Clostridia bacterium]